MCYRFPICRNKKQFPLLFKVIAGTITLLMLTEAITLSEGYGHTCNGYKTLVIKYLKVGFL